MKESNWKIELWDKDTQHVYLATGEDGEVLEFEFHDRADYEAKEICNKAYRDFDQEYNYFITKTPHRRAKPL